MNLPFLPHRSTGDFNGYGCMALSIRNLDKQKEWLLPKVNIQLFNRVLCDFANHFDIGKHKQVVLVLDRAGWHTSKGVEVPEGMHLSFLPSHSPELQPAERLWTITNEAIALSLF